MMWQKARLVPHPWIDNNRWPIGTEFWVQIGKPEERLVTDPARQRKLVRTYSTNIECDDEYAYEPECIGQLMQVLQDNVELLSEFREDVLIIPEKEFLIGIHERTDRAPQSEAAPQSRSEGSGGKSE